MDATNLNTKDTASTAVSIVPKWFWAAAGLGAAWNAYGVFQFAQAILATRESLIAMGMTDAQATVMSSYPMWMTIAFAIGTIGGLVGSILLLARNRQATPVFLASLIGYIILYIGDITEGVFAAVGVSQVIILSIVVTISAALLFLSRMSERNGTLA